MKNFKKIYKLIVVVITISLAVVTSAQDVHFSQYYNSPMTLNPAMTGVFNGQIRANMSYRNQWGGFSNNGAAFRTYSASTDGHITNLALKRNFIGLGLGFYQDKAGEAGLYTQNISFSNSLGLNFSRKKKSNVFILGYQFAVLVRGLEYSNLTFGSQYINNSFDATAPNNERRFDEFRFGYDFSAGGLWISKMSDLLSFYAGAAMFHINRPNQSFFKTGTDPIARRISIHGGAKYTFGRMFDLLPTLLIENQGRANSTVAGMTIMFSDQGVKKNPNKPVAYLGGMVRFNDAFIATVGMKKNGTKIQFSYDFNLSPLTQGSRFKGGPEISIELTGKVGRMRGAVHIPSPRV